MSGKYYGVKKGRNIGVFDNWKEAEKSIKGFSNASYKSFLTYEEAFEFIKMNDNNEKKMKPEIIAFVDGSFSEKLKMYSYGLLIMKGEKKILLENGKNDNKDFIEMRNVAGELLGATKAIKWAIDNSYKSIEINYDYMGIEKWATSEWKANKKGTKEYIEFISNSRKKINIHFNKIKAHSGNEYNEIADKLASQAFLTSQRNENNNYLSVFNETLESNNIVKKNDVEFVLKNYVLTKSIIEKFIKKVWKMEGYLLKNISHYHVTIDSNDQFISWYVLDNNGKKYEFKLEF